MRLQLIFRFIEIPFSWLYWYQKHNDKLWRPPEVLAFEGSISDQNEAKILHGQTGGVRADLQIIHTSVIYKKKSAKHNSLEKTSSSTPSVVTCLLSHSTNQKELSICFILVLVPQSYQWQYHWNSARHICFPWELTDNWLRLPIPWTCLYNTWILPYHP